MARLGRFDGGVAQPAAEPSGWAEFFDVSVGSLIDPLVLLSPVRESAEIVDFAYHYANDAACYANVLGREELVGTRMLERRTQLAPVGLFSAYAAVMQTGEPLVLDGVAQPTRRGGEPDQRFFDVRALKAGDLLVLTWRDVTDHDRAEAERIRLAAIVGSSDDAIMSLDVDLRVTSWNRGAEEVYGYSSGEILGQSSEILVPLDATPDRRDLREWTVPGGKVHRYETQRLCKDGSVIDVAITTFVQIDAAGGEAGMTTITRDISEQVRAARPLALSDDRYREILDAIPDGVWRVDAGEETDYVNSRMTDMLGYPPEEMIGRELADFMDPEWRPRSQQQLEAIRREGGTGVLEHCFQRKDGTRCWTRVSHRPLVDQEGVYSGTLAIVSDSTAANAQTLELRETERLLAALTESMAEGVCATDRDGRVTYMNQAAERLLGWSKADLRGRPLHHTVHQHDPGSANAAADCPLVEALGTAAIIRVEDDTFVRRDGRPLPVAYSAAPVTTDDEVAGVVVVFTDATPRRAEEERRDREHEKMNWVGRIRDALDDDRLVLYAQPIIDVTTRTVVMHELLVRMTAGDGAIIPPGRFLPAAEQFGLIEDIDRWVLARAMKVAACGRKVHFNISGKTLGSRELINDLVRGLRDTGADPALLVCEITETALASDEAVAEAFVHELSELGCEIALDDFGIGYGGFVYLKRLPVTMIKIDMQFVRDLIDNAQNQYVVKAIVNLAQGFGRQTIAEGVEDQATLDRLGEYGVDYAQGFAIGRPAPIDSAFADVSSSASAI